MRFDDAKHLADFLLLLYAKHPRSCGWVCCWILKKNENPQRPRHLLGLVLLYEKQPRSCG